ncbi:hypothetical protein MBGDN05_00545 [Thermoplasmatales archaeon SCGC AB-539-N05]|jgi:hypothetical protein|nr:hypothetical protein MBGDN05_00545 [Thermoplasmatales archaeon SCGC AB-539-N05]
MKEKIQEGCFCRVRNRIDIIGKVTRINRNFVCLDIPQFKGNMEYLSDLVEFVDQ